MKVITARNVNDAYATGMNTLRDLHVSMNTRNGPALVYPDPVTTHYSHPQERVLWNQNRDANPFFHLIEALWMLDGRSDHRLITYLVPHMANYLEEGATDATSYFHGAYGVRWRNHFRPDQLDVVIRLLRENPRDRRIMLQMWDCEADLGRDVKDAPCNVIVKFMTDPAAPNTLNMVVFCRSNDIIWGCYGANAVHFSVLLEYVATMADLTAGWYEQVSCDWHAYDDVFMKHIAGASTMYETPYTTMKQVKVTPIVTVPSEFNYELTQCMDEAHDTMLIHPKRALVCKNAIFGHVVSPMLKAYALYRAKKLDEAIDHVSGAISAYGSYDWLYAAQLWLGRRQLAKALRQ